MAEPAPRAARLSPGDVRWAVLEPVRGREQGGRRPVLVVASAGYLEVVESLALVVPLTTRDRGWPDHVPVAGAHALTTPSWAMTEQLRTLSRDRLRGDLGRLSEECLARVRTWLGDFLDLP